jgi:hypothetical protein
MTRQESHTQYALDQVVIKMNVLPQHSSSCTAHISFACFILLIHIVTYNIYYIDLCTCLVGTSSHVRPKRLINLVVRQIWLHPTAGAMLGLLKYNLFSRSCATKETTLRFWPRVWTLVNTHFRCIFREMHLTRTTTQKRLLHTKQRLLSRSQHHLAHSKQSKVMLQVRQPRLRKRKISPRKRSLGPLGRSLQSGTGMQKRQLMKTWGDQTHTSRCQAHPRPPHQHPLHQGPLNKRPPHHQHRLRSPRPSPQAHLQHVQGMWLLPRKRSLWPLGPLQILMEGGWPAGWS